MKRYNKAAPRAAHQVWSSKNLILELPIFLSNSTLITTWWYFIHHLSSTKRSSITIIPNQTTQVPILSHGLMCIPHLCSAWCIRLCHQWRRRNAIISTATSYTRLQYIPKAMDGWFIIETLSCFLVGEEAGLEEVEGGWCCWCGWLWLLWHFWCVARIFWRRKQLIIITRRIW